MAMVPVQNAQWLDLYGSRCMGRAPPCRSYCDYAQAFEVADIEHAGECGRPAQNTHGVQMCQCCYDICAKHNIALRERAIQCGGAAWVANGGLAHSVIAPVDAKEAGDYLHELMLSYDRDTGHYRHCPAAENIRGFDGFTLLNGRYDAEDQACSTCILYASDVAALGAKHYSVC